MNSPLLFNYDTRPVKFTERRMFLAILLKICNWYGKGYSYIGFGGLSFTDFKLFHKELHIDEMHSIEGGEKIHQDRINFNNPFSFIKIHNGFSTNILRELDLSKKVVVWLDYDEQLDNYFFEDIALLFTKLVAGSVFIVTCNRELKDKDNGGFYTEVSFREKFEGLAPFHLSKDSFTGLQNFKTIRNMLKTNIESYIDPRKKEGENVRFQQLFNILYSENNGAPMYTFGGVIVEEEFDLEKLGLNIFPFISTDENPFRLNIPHLTNKEIDYINSTSINNYSKLSSTIISKDQFDKYELTYKYLPQYFDVKI